MKWPTRIGVLLALTIAVCAPDSVARAQDGAESLRQLSNTFRSAYEQVKPAVVQIATTRSWRFARQTLPESHPPVDPDAYRGLGSGTTVSDDGYILSNYHVVSGADSVVVTLTDRRTFGAEVVGFDSLIDIDFKIDMISFTNEKKSSQLVLPVQKVTEPVPIDESKYSSKEKTLITVTSILAFALFAVSAILIWVAGGWLALRKQVKILIQNCP